MKNYNIINGMRRLLLMVILLVLWGNTADANSMSLPDELSETGIEGVNTFIYVTQNTKGYEEADTQSQIVAELKENQKLFLVLQLEDGWCQVMDEGKLMYIEMKYIEKLPMGEELNQEMEALEKVYALEVEQDIIIRKKVIQKRIGGGVIAILITGIFIIGIFTALSSKEKVAAEKHSEEVTEKESANKPVGDR